MNGFGIEPNGLFASGGAFAKGLTTSFAVWFIGFGGAGAPGEGTVFGSFAAPTMAAMAPGGAGRPAMFCVCESGFVGGGAE